MDARQVLQSTLAPDAAERTNAEQQLAHAAEVDFVCFPCPSHTRYWKDLLGIWTLIPPLSDRLPTLLLSAKNLPTRAVLLISVSLPVLP